MRHGGLRPRAHIAPRTQHLGNPDCRGLQDGRPTLEPMRGRAAREALRRERARGRCPGSAAREMEAIPGGGGRRMGGDGASAGKVGGAVLRGGEGGAGARGAEHEVLARRWRRLEAVEPRHMK